jgi:hypothetical protein
MALRDPFPPKLLQPILNSVEANNTVRHKMNTEVPTARSRQQYWWFPAVFATVTAWLAFLAFTAGHFTDKGGREHSLTHSEGWEFLGYTVALLILTAALFWWQNKRKTTRNPKL